MTLLPADPFQLVPPTLPHPAAAVCEDWDPLQDDTGFDPGWGGGREWAANSEKLPE